MLRRALPGLGETDAVAKVRSNGVPRQHSQACKLPTPGSGQVLMGHCTVSSARLCNGAAGNMCAETHKSKHRPGPATSLLGRPVSSSRLETVYDGLKRLGTGSLQTRGMQVSEFNDLRFTVVDMSNRLIVSWGTLVATRTSPRPQMPYLGRIRVFSS